MMLSKGGWEVQRQQYFNDYVQTKSLYKKIENSKIELIVRI